ncbi:MAG: hypothetical protein MR419_05870 [Clostridiales bacterium]|nr:hypothetical protein [Clostridiales bacterium]MDY4172715.1 hypothetical protein [Evtepia sp.]
MKQLRTLCLVLAACLLVAVGFSLPWAVSAWQDKDLGSQIQQYEAAPIQLAGLMDHLKLAAQDYSRVSLNQASQRLSVSQAQQAAQSALEAMDEFPLTFFSTDHLFAPDQWTLTSTVPFLAVGNVTVTTAPDYKVQVAPQVSVTPTGDRDLTEVSGASAAIFWTCIFTRGPEQLELILDDETGKMLSFSYENPASADTIVTGNTAVSPSFSMEDAFHMMEFCQRYYNLNAEDFSDPLYLSPAGYLLPVKDDQGKVFHLSLISAAYYDDASSQYSYTSDRLLLSFNCFSYQVDAGLMSN